MTIRKFIQLKPHINHNRLRVTLSHYIQYIEGHALRVITETNTEVTFKDLDGDEHTLPRTEVFSVNPFTL